MNPYMIANASAQSSARSTWILLAINLVCLLAAFAETRAAQLIARKRGIALSRTHDITLLSITLALSAADWALLWSLPWLRLSFSEEYAIPGLITLLFRLSLLWALQTARLISCWYPPSSNPTRQAKTTLALFLTLGLAFTIAQIDAYVIEPLLIETTQLSLAFDDLHADTPPIRIVHITDTHIERYSYREAALVRQVNALEPDIVVLTGDYLNLSRLRDATSAEHWRGMMSQINAPYGIYATRGTVEPTPSYMQALVEGTNVTWLEQRTAELDIRGQTIALLGVACSHNQQVDQARLQESVTDVALEEFTVLLFHSPDLIEEAAREKIDLYLGGHTHGGQIRLPIVGALFTGSTYGRQYVNGLFEKGDTRMYISRGLGFEGGPAPRARFLCRPEIVSLELRGR